MESLLIEMHKKLDILKLEKDCALDELKMISKSFARLEKEYEMSK